MFIIGYGLDYNDRYRGLKHIVVMSDLGKRISDGNKVTLRRGPCLLMCSMVICPRASMYCKCSGKTKQATSKQDNVYKFNNYQKVMDAN